MAVPFIVYGAMAGLQLLSGVQQANNIQRQAELQKKLDEFNVEQAQLDAFNAEKDGYTQMARYENVINEIQSTQRNNYYAADVNPNFGTAADLQADSKLTGQLNLLDIQSQAHQRALGYKKQANAIRGQSGLNQIGASLQADTTRNTAVLGAANTLLTGYERNGGFGNIKKPQTNVAANESSTYGGDNVTALYGWSPATYNSKYFGRLGGK